MRLLVLVLVLCLLAGAPASAQLAPAEVDAAIAVLADEAATDDEHAAAAFRLASLGEAAPPRVVAALTGALESDDKALAVTAAWALSQLGAAAAPAVPALIDAMRDPDNYTATDELPLDLGRGATTVLEKIGAALQAKGKHLWWAVPYAYRTEGLVLLLFLALWFACARNLPRRREDAALARVVMLGVTAIVPSVVAGASILHVLTRGWAQGYLPGSPLTVVPLPVAAVLSVLFCCVLATVWAAQRPADDAGVAPPPTESASCAPTK